MRQEILWNRNDGREVPIGIPIIAILHFGQIKSTAFGSFSSIHRKWGEKYPLKYDPADNFLADSPEIIFLQVFPFARTATIIPLDARIVVAWAELPNHLIFT